MPDAANRQELPDWDDFAERMESESDLVSNLCFHRHVSTRASARGKYRVCDDCDAYLGHEMRLNPTDREAGGRSVT